MLVEGLAELRRDRRPSCRTGTCDVRLPAETTSAAPIRRRIGATSRLAKTSPSQTADQQHDQRDHREHQREGDLQPSARASSSAYSATLACGLPAAARPRADRAAGRRRGRCRRTPRSRITRRDVIAASVITAICGSAVRRPRSDDCRRRRRKSWLNCRSARSSRTLRSLSIDASRPAGCATLACVVSNWRNVPRSWSNSGRGIERCRWPWPGCRRG